jgi:phosphoserine phosphatase RsbU/P
MDSVLVQPPEGRSFRCEIGSGTLRIGRSLQNDLVLTDKYVSRHHAEIVRHPEGCYLVDVGAKAGVQINGSPMERPVLLRPGDTIRIGATVLVFQGDSEVSVVFEDRPLAEESGTVVLSAPPAAGTFAGDTVSFAEAPVEGGKERGEKPGAADRGREKSPLSPLDLFAEADRELLFHRPLEEIFGKILDLAGMAVPFERGVLMIREGDGWSQAAVRTPGVESGGPIPISRTLADRVLHRRESFLTTDALADERFRDGQSVVAQQIRSAMCVPLWNNREVIGLIYVDSRRHPDLFTQENLQVLAHLANIAAVKIENCRLFGKTLEAQTVEREIRRAAEIQRFLLPAADPSIPGYRVHGESVPCHAVGGDYFEYLLLPGGRFGIALGDVSGKGFAASLLMCSFQASLVALAEIGLPPSEVAVRLNQTLHRRFPESRFVTLFYGVLDPVRHTLTYVNAGHCPPLLLSRDGAFRALAQTGRPVGLFEDSHYAEGEAEFQPGDAWIGFTDGIPTARNGQGEWYGEERIRLFGREASEGEPSGAVEKLLTDVERFLAGKPREDDLTAVILRRDV